MDKLFFKTRLFTAEGLYSAGTVVILKGSQAKKDTLTSFTETMQNKRSDMLDSGIMIDCGDLFVFTQNYPCNSASEASSLIYGGSSNGLTCWKDKDGKTLKWKLRHDPLYNNEITKS